jgi:glycosyltransferase involved in cell wall biosynthesis
MESGPQYWANRSAGRRAKILLSRWSVRRARLVLAISRSLQADVQQDLPRCAKKVQLLLSGAPSTSIESKPVANLEQPFVLSLANDYPHKRLETVASAWESAGLPGLLVFAGDISDDRRSQIVDHVGIDRRSRIVFLGSVPDPAQVAWLLDHARCMISTSDLEAHPLTPAEAGAHGCPLVVSDIPPHREVCGDHALFVDPSSSIEDWAEGLRAAWDLPRKHWVYPHSWHEHGDALVTFWEGQSAPHRDDVAAAAGNE